MARSNALTPIDRLTVRAVGGAPAAGSFADDVRIGLASKPKSIPPRHFYDALGSKLFEAICELDEYYLTRAEHEILRSAASEMLARVRGPVRRPVRILELGSGSGEKTERFFDAAFAHQQRLIYHPIDVSEAAITASSARMLERFPGLHIRAVHGAFLDGLAAIEAPAEGERTVALFLGSSVGNLEDGEAIALFAQVREAVGPEGALVLGTDLKKSSDVLVPAYDDPTGVTAAFNKNLLGRVNRELGGRFDLASFRHVALYDVARGRIELHLESLRDQRVPIRALGVTVEFSAGERIHTENSYKYDAADVERLAAAASLRVVDRWTDANGHFASSLLVPNLRA